MDIKINKEYTNRTKCPKCCYEDYYCFNCGEYIAIEDPIYFLGRIILCKYCAEHDPMLKIVSSRRYMIQNDLKLIKYSLKYDKISNKKNSTLVYVGFSERISKLFQRFDYPAI